MFDLITYDSDGRPRLTVVIENKTPTIAFFVGKNATNPSTNFATKDTRNQYSVLDFDDSTNESTIFVGLIPQQYTGTDIEVRLFYAMTSATSGDVDWQVKMERLTSSDQDIDSASYSVVTSSVNNTVPSTSGHLAIVSITMTKGTNIDNVAVGDMFALQITRDASTDTASGDAELFGVEMRGT
jgi:hypothetical protein